MAEPPYHDSSKPEDALEPLPDPPPEITSDAKERDPADQLQAALVEDHGQELERLIWELPSGELGRAFSRLDSEQQMHLLNTVPTQTAGFLFEQINHPQAAEIIEGLSDTRAAMILDELPSDEQADVLGELGDTAAAAIIEKMAPEEAQDARLLISYDPDTAGGIMITEYLAFFESMSVDDVLQDIRTNAADYHTYDVQYVYVIGSGGELRGVVRLRDLVIRPRGTKLSDIMIDNPRFLPDSATLDDLEQFFDAHHFFAVPVVNDRHHLLGLARREAVEEALSDRSEKTLMRFGGIIAGEENRQMPVISRAVRRLAFLAPNIGLNLISASVIAFFEPTIARVTALAIFLPILSDMSGCSGNQAVAVSIRELSLGLVRPTEVVRTILKEISVGAINGIILGMVVGSIAYGMRGSDFAPIGLVVGGALAADSVIAVALGGCIPLVLKRVGIDPAMASGPILTTFTDLCGFFFALFLATICLPPEPAQAAGTAMLGAVHVFG